MTTIRTASYRSFRPSMGQPVVISLTTPKWRPEAASWPRCESLTPRWKYFRKPEAREAFQAQLSRYGPRRITRALQQIATDTGADTLVLLCHEADWNRCHRQQFAEWFLAATGEVVTEIT